MTQKYKFVAHVSEDGREQSIVEHLQGTAIRCAEFAEAFDSKEQGNLVGLIHDIGKFSDAFQRRICGSKEHVDHSSAGMFECWKNKQLVAVFSVAGHHGGLPDGGKRTDSPDNGTLWGRLNRIQSVGIEPYDAWTSNIKITYPTLPEFVKKDPKALMFYTRMIYSCLVDGDFLDTESFMNQTERENIKISICELEQRLNKYIKKWEPAQGILNLTRSKILNICKSEREEKSGLFTLTVPTGGGKTISSLAFALAHAKVNKKERIIYIVPYTSIIEQTADVFRSILGNDVILEHHSGAIYDLNQNSESYRMAQATENWDYPIIVTTAVQFFESLYHNRSSKCRKLHNIANSVLIFDEAQMLPLPYLRPCVYAIAQLVEHYNVTSVLCTATQPALDDLLKEFLQNYSVDEICPSELYEQPIFKRVMFKYKTSYLWSELAIELKKHDQVLCIVNTRNNAYNLYQNLSTDESFCLSTLLYPAHRQKIFAEIRNRLDNGLPCKVISTSLIEAGVDLDFPCVYREEAGLDSILQAAGRCNREGKRPKEESIVTVFKSETPIPERLSAAVNASRIVMNKFDDFSNREATKCYFVELLSLLGKDSQDKHGILKMMEDKELPFAKIAENFHMIEQDGQTIYIPLDEGETLINQLRKKQYSRMLYRKLGQYGVTIYKSQFEMLNKAGAIEKLEDGSFVLIKTEFYDKKTGLTSFI